jgi:hypothetical protein
MYELIQIFQADEDALLTIGSNEGKLKKITADFIEDYASDLENPSIMLQRISFISKFNLNYLRVFNKNLNHNHRSNKKIPLFVMEITVTSRSLHLSQDI